MNADSHPRAPLGEHKPEGRSHHTRAHAVWSASATSRNVVCPGAIAMSTLVDDRESEAAAWGSACHQLSEHCLHKGTLAIAHLNTIEKSGKFEFVVDEDMANCSQTYVDYCRGRVKEYHDDGFEHDEAQFWIESKLSLDSLNPPLEAGGTADFVIYFPRWRLLEVVDLKGGRGVMVDVKGNPQGRSYAIGALLTLTDIAVDRITVTIVQPRVGNGEPKSETFHIAELLDWTVDLLASMQRSREALDEFNALGGNRVSFDAWAERWLTTGQCVFCPAQSICPKLRGEVMANMPAVAAKWFEEPDAPAPDLSNAPRLASPEELARWLDGFEMLESWIKQTRAHAHAEAERGVAIPGYQLADKIGNRKWIDEVKASEALVTLGLTEKQIFEEKFRSPAQIEKVLDAKRKKEIEPLVERPVTGTNLVSVDKSTRPAAKNIAERYFEQL